MKIIAFQITGAKDIPFQTQASTLDEMTRELPQGFYTTFSTLSNGTRVLGLHAHLQRLYAPAIEHEVVPSADELELRFSIAALVKMNLPKESRIRLIMAKTNGMIYLGIQPFEPLSKSIYEDGVKVITADSVRQAPQLRGAKEYVKRKLSSY